MAHLRAQDHDGLLEGFQLRRIGGMGISETGTTQETERAANTVTVRYDRAGKLYYVDRLGFLGPHDWLSLEKGEDDKYTIYPFAFYEIKSGREEQVPADHELVKRYAKSQNWPEPGTVEYGTQLTRYLSRTRMLLADSQRSAAFYEREIALCEELDQRHLEIATAVG